MNTKEIALVTGAGSGIGAEVAITLAARGASVVLVDISPVGLQATEALITASDDSPVSAVVDVRDDQSVARAVQLALDTFGGLHTVVACAGVEVLGDVTTLQVSDWERAISVNLNGVYNLARHAIPALARGGGGTFTAIASDAGIQGAQGYAAYCASKHAVVGLIKCMALDHGPQGVRSNVVCPAMVETPMSDRIFEEVGGKEFYSASVPLGRFARPQEVAAAVAHLSSQDAAYTNGMTYMVDGGATAGYFEGSAGT